MNKQEFFDVCKKKLGMKKEEFEALYKESVEEIKKRDIPESEIETTAVKRARALLKKQLKSRAEFFEGIIIGKDRITDFGAQKLYDEARRLWKEDPEKAVQDGYVNEDGEPLYLEPDWKKGKKIILDEAKGRTVFLLAKHTDDTDYKLAFLNLRHDKINIETPMFCKVEFRANKSQKSTDNLYILNQANVTEFKVIDDKRVDFITLAKKYLKNYLVNLADLREWYEKHKDDRNRIAIIKGNVSSISITAEGVSNKMELDDAELAIDADPDKIETVTCWVPEDLEFDFSEGTIDLVVIGRPDYNTERDEIVINVFGMYASDEWLIKEKPQKIVIENTNTENVNNEQKDVDVNW